MRYDLTRYMSDQNHKVQLTKEGYLTLKTELEELVSSKRPATLERLSHARSMGDLAENSDYHQAKEALEFIDGRISELEDVLSKAEVVEGIVRGGEVSFGAKVRVGINGQEHTFHIVGEWEADPKERKISHVSPLGRALLGKKVGEKVEVEAPAGKVQYTIISIE